MSALRVGVIGLNSISRFYVSALQRLPSWHLAAVCDRNPEALTPLQGAARCHLDHRDLLNGGDLDGVIITAPNHLHATVCRDVLAAGLPVCIEKPLATLPSDGAALRAEADLRGTPLFTAFHRRYNRSVRALVGRLPAGVPITSVRVRYLQDIEDQIGPERWYLDPERCGGGCVADNGTDAFDLARMLLGELSVTRAHIAYDTSGVDRQAQVRLRAADGAEAAVELDWSYPGECKDIQVRLADGRTETADMLSGFGGYKASLWHEYEGILQDFGQRLRGGPTLADDNAGTAALNLVDSAYRTQCGERQPATAARPQAIRDM